SVEPVKDAQQRIDGAQVAVGDLLGRQPQRAVEAGALHDGVLARRIDLPPLQALDDDLANALARQALGYGDPIVAASLLETRENSAPSHLAVAGGAAGSAGGGVWGSGHRAGSGVGWGTGKPG